MEDRWTDEFGLSDEVRDHCARQKIVRSKLFPKDDGGKNQRKKPALFLPEDKVYVRMIARGESKLIGSHIFSGEESRVRRQWTESIFESMCAENC